MPVPEALTAAAAQDPSERVSGQALYMGALIRTGERDDLVDDEQHFRETGSIRAIPRNPPHRRSHPPSARQRDLWTRATRGMDHGSWQAWSGVFDEDYDFPFCTPPPSVYARAREVAAHVGVRDDRTAVRFVAACQDLQLCYRDEILRLVMLCARDEDAHTAHAFAMRFTDAQFATTAAFAQCPVRSALESMADRIIGYRRGPVAHDLHDDEAYAPPSDLDDYPDDDDW
jgi:hypothetical protein